MNYKVDFTYIKDEEDSKGNPKQVKHRESYLVNAEMSFSDAEARATELAKTFGGNGNVSVDNITKSKIVSVFNEYQGDKLWEADVKFSWEDDNGKVKSSVEKVLVSANTLLFATQNLLKEYNEDYDIVMVKESKILDFYNGNK